MCIGEYCLDAMSEHTTLVEYLHDRPRVAGVLFMTLLLLSQAGAAQANALTYYAGP